MAGVVVGTITKVDPARRTILVGGLHFLVPKEVSLAGIVEGMSVTITYELVEGKHRATEIRANPPA